MTANQWCEWYADTYLLVKILTASPQARQVMGDAVVISTIVSYALAVLVSILSAYLKIEVLVSLRKRRNIEFALTTRDDAYTLKHSKRKGDVAKSLHMAYANLLAGLLEDLPLGLIGIQFINLSAHRPDLFEPLSFFLLLSVFSSAFSMCSRLRLYYTHTFTHT